MTAPLLTAWPQLQQSPSTTKLLAGFAAHRRKLLHSNAHYACDGCDADRDAPGRDWCPSCNEVTGSYSMVEDGR